MRATRRNFIKGLIALGLAPAVGFNRLIEAGPSVGPQVRSMSSMVASKGTSISMALPGECKAGDMLMGFVHRDGPGGVSWPAGWTEMESTETSSAACKTFEPGDEYAVAQLSGELGQAAGCLAVISGGGEVVERSEVRDPWEMEVCS